MGDNDKRLDYITNIRTVSTLFIVLGHCMLFFDANPFFPERSGIISEPVAFAYKYIDMTLIAAYVFCSGFLYARVLEKHQRSIASSILERAKRLLVPYYLYGALWVVPLYTFFDIKTFGREPEHAGYLQGYKCMLLGRFADHLWFLWMLFWVSLFFILTSWFIKRRKFVILFILTVAAAVFDSVMLCDFPYFKLSQIAPHLIVYFVGIICYTYRERIENLPALVHVLIAFALFAVMTVYAWAGDIADLSHFAFIYVIKTVGALFMLFVFLAIGRTAFWKSIADTAAYRYLVRHGVELYLINMPFPYLYFRLFFPHTGQHVWLCILLMFTHSMLAIVLFIQLKHMIFAAKSRICNRGSVNEK